MNKFGFIVKGNKESFGVFFFCLDSNKTKLLLKSFNCGGIDRSPGGSGVGNTIFFFCLSHWAVHLCPAVILFSVTDRPVNDRTRLGSCTEKLELPKSGTSFGLPVA